MDAEQRRAERRRISEEKKRAQLKLQGKLESEDNNPCLNEHNLTNKCMLDNNYNEDSCHMYFENYKACKTFWWSISRARRLKGIVPELPPADERVKIKADYTNQFRNGENLVQNKQEM